MQTLMTVEKYLQESIHYLVSKLTEFEKDWNCWHAEIFYPLFLINHPLVNEYRKKSENDNFWENLDAEGFSENLETIYYLIKMGFTNSVYFNEMYKTQFLDAQTVSGQFYNEHPQAFRCIVQTDPTSKGTELALTFLLKNWTDFSCNEIAHSILSLIELNYLKYKNIISEMCEHLISFQDISGYISDRKNEAYDYSFNDTCISIEALIHFEKYHSNISKAIDFIKNFRDNAGYFSDKSDNNAFHLLYSTANAILPLLYTTDGPKSPILQQDFKYLITKQKDDLFKPVAIHTSPIYKNSLHVKELYENITCHIKQAQNSIMICSPYLDMLYDEILESSINKSVSVKIITRPKADIKGVRERISKNVIDLLRTATKGNIRVCPLLHARMIIFDENTVIISSADLTRDQLFDEFNIGVLTQEPITVQKAILFFNNIWNESDELT